MNLEGSLDVFSLPDILTLLTGTRKTGGLHLSQGQVDGVVWFTDGSVNGASSDGSRQSLARRLVGSGTVGDDVLRAAVDRASAEAGVGVAKALLDLGAVDAEMLRTAARDQTVDAVSDLLGWPAGSFSFAPDETNPDDVGLALTVAEIVDETASRGGEWERLRRLVPSTDSVLRIPPTPPADLAVAPEEWALIALVDGRRSVRDLIELTGAVRFSVVARLAGLIERGLLVTVEEGEDPALVLARRQALLDRLESGEPLQPAPEDGAVVGADAVLAPLRVRSRDRGDATAVVPARPEPFLPGRVAEFAEATPAGPVPSAPRSERAAEIWDETIDLGGGPPGSMTLVDYDPGARLERDPGVDRALMLRLIAGVRAL